MLNLKNKKVLVPGSSSMIGGEICKALAKRQAKVFTVDHHTTDLLYKYEVNNLFNKCKPDFVVNASGYNGGISFSALYPADIFFRTSMMCLNILSACQEFSVQKVVSIISSCAYPDNSTGILKEGTLWENLPNPSIECHGLSKRVMDGYSRALFRQHALNAVSVILTNCYGPRDNFDPMKTKAVGSIINKVVQAHRHNLPSVECFGTGRPLRELLFSEDAGELIVRALELHDDPLVPLNIGSNIEVSIQALVNIIVDAVGYKGEVKWLTDRPDGQMRKLLDTTHLRQLTNFEPTDLTTGIRKTVDWYIENFPAAD